MGDRQETTVTGRLRTAWTSSSTTRIELDPDGVAAWGTTRVGDSHAVLDGFHVAQCGEPIGWPGPNRRPIWTPPHRQPACPACILLAAADINDITAPDLDESRVALERTRGTHLRLVDKHV
jgi:hypothetical protein